MPSGTQSPVASHQPARMQRSEDSQTFLSLNRLIDLNRKSIEKNKAVLQCYTTFTPRPLECEFFAIISLTVAFIKILRTRYEVQLLISHLLARSIGYVNLWPLLSKHEIFLEAKNTIFQRSYRLCFLNSSCTFAHGDSLTPKVIHIWWREKNH